jgi:hypothetical protein
LALGSQLAQQLQPFWLELLEKGACTRDVAAGTMQAADEAAPDRVAAGHEDDWYSRGRRFGRKRRWIAADCNDDGNLPLHEISDQRAQSIVLAIGPTIIDDDVSITDESGFTEALLEHRDERRVRDKRTGAEQTDHWHRRLLRARREWPRCCCAANKRDASRRFIGSPRGSQEVLNEVGAVGASDW